MLLTDAQQQMKKLSIVELQRELKDQQEDNKDMYSKIMLNQEAQDVAMFKDGYIKTLSEEHKDTLIKSFSLENEQLKSLIEKMTQDRNGAQSKAILIEQQSEENENFKKMMRSELDERIKEIRKILFEKESVIQQIEIDKTNNQNGQKESSDQQNENSSMLVHKDVLTASIPLFRIHEETEQLKKEIGKSVQQIENLNQKNKKCRSTTKQIRFLIEQLKYSLLSKSYKKHKCATEQQNIFSDDEDYNCAHLQTRVSSFEKQKIKMMLLAEKADLFQMAKMKNEYLAGQGQPTQRNQKISQMEADIEKYKNLTQIWQDQNKRKVYQIKKLQRYNQTLEKSNEQLIDNYNKLQQKINQMNTNLKQFKDSYSQIMNRKKMRNHSQNISSLLNSSLNSQSTQANYNTTGHNESIFSPKQQQAKHVNFDDIGKKPDEKELLSVEEEELDEDISQRRTLSQYQSIGLKNNELQKKLTQYAQGDFYYDDYFDKKPFPPLQRKKSCTSYLYKIKQQIDKLKNQFSFSLSIPPNDVNYVNVSQLPQQQIKIKRSLSECTIGVPQNQKYSLWSINKRKTLHFVQYNPLMFAEDESIGEDGDICNSMNRNEDKRRKGENAQINQNNTFFRELDISVIQYEKKNKKM